MNDDEMYMKKALHYAALAAKQGEVPVGAVIVRDGEIISWGYNSREKGKNALRHAEITAIDRACRKLGGWRLSGCSMYVTLEPCPMCAGAIINSRITKVFIGAQDSKAGAFGSVMEMNSFGLNHKPEVSSGLLASESSALLSNFFSALREKKSKNRPE